MLTTSASTGLIHGALPDAFALVFERVSAEVRPAREPARTSFHGAFVWPLECDTHARTHMHTHRIQYAQSTTYLTHPSTFKPLKARAQLFAGAFMVTPAR